MPIVFYDTETTGIPDFKARSSDPFQPHLVQLALILCDDDGEQLASKSVIIKPDGWVISPEMTAIHRISHERAMDEGIPEPSAVEMFMIYQSKAGLRSPTTSHSTEGSCALP